MKRRRRALLAGLLVGLPAVALIWLLPGSRLMLRREPSLLVVADSIGWDGWGEYLEGYDVRLLPQNAQSSTFTLSQVPRWLEPAPEIILWNNGHWDYRIRRVDGRNAVPVDQYEGNLEAIAEILQAGGAFVVFVLTSPNAAHPELPVLYNETARRVMDARGIPVIDLHSFCLDELSREQMIDYLHWNHEARAAQAGFIGRELRALREARPR